MAAVATRLPDTLIALDFDGTLAPIVDDPDAARPTAGAVEVLVRLARLGSQIAIVTGRPVQQVIDVGRLDRVPRLLVEGIYGAQRWADGHLDTVSEPAAMRAARAELPITLDAAGDAAAGVRIEDKGLSLVVHARGTARPEALDAIAGPVGDLARRLGLELHRGRQVLELRLPGHDKATALRRVVAATEPRAVVYAGDDVGDLPAFAVVDELRRDGRSGWTIAVASAEAPAVVGTADVQVDSPAGLVALLDRLAAHAATR